jgi:hypothetical protein
VFDLVSGPLRPLGEAAHSDARVPLRRSDVVQAHWPDVPVAAIDPADIAAVAAAVLTQPGHEGVAHPLMARGATIRR